MKVQYASDLHIEFYDNSVFLARGPFKVAGDVLVLAGDTLLLKDFDTYSKHRFFDWCAENYRETFLVPGNHEYYRDDVAGYPDSWERKLRPNVTLCENRSVVMDDTEFILSTLWSHIPMGAWLKVKKGMSDFTLIRHEGGPFTASVYNALHRRDLAFIKGAVSGSRAAHKVVVTHHVPSRLLVAPEFKGSSLESGFTVDLTDYIASSGVDLWVYGHSHRSIDRVIGKTRVVSNQVGYVAYGEYNRNFSGDRFVDLDEEGALPRDKEDVLHLTSRYGEGPSLVRTSPDSPWYRLSGPYESVRIIGGEGKRIDAFDPDGGPLIGIGYEFGSRAVQEICLKDGEILVRIM